jgi:aspartate aminotransferase
MSNSKMLSDRITGLSESQTLEMAKKARELAESGVKVINLSLGEPDFATPMHIRQAAAKAIEGGYTYYPPVAGYADLRKAISEKLRRDNGLNWEAKNIVVSAGAKQSIANAMMCLINPGDEVVVLCPYWVSYLEIIKLAEGVPVLVEGTIDQGFKVSANQLEKAITHKTKAVIFSSPCNPTGAVWSKEELIEYAKVLKDHPHVYLISDEIYEYINFAGEHFSIGSLPEIAERVITINGFSKGFAMTGWRVGYMAANSTIAAACEKMQGQITSGTCSIAQRAAYAAMTESLQPTFDMAAVFKNRRDLMLELIRKIPGIDCPTPDGAFYLFPSVAHYLGKSYLGQRINTPADLCLLLLKDYHVSTVTGEAFGNHSCIRLSYAASDDQIKEAIKKLGEFLAKFE